MSIPTLLLQLIEEKGTELTMKEVKRYLTDRNTILPEKSALKTMVQDALEKFDNSALSQEKPIAVQSSNIVVNKVKSEVVVQEIKDKVKSSETKPKVEAILEKYANENLLKESQDSIKTKNVKPVKEKKKEVTSIPKNMKPASSLYPYLKAATISIPYKKLKGMSAKDQYVHLVELLTDGFEKCNIELPLENKTTSKFYGISDRKWTIDSCKEVRDELELKREVEGLEIEGEVSIVPVEKKRRSRTSTSQKVENSSSDSVNGSSEESDAHSSVVLSSASKGSHSVEESDAGSVSPKRRVISSDSDDEAPRKKVKEE